MLKTTKKLLLVLVLGVALLFCGCYSWPNSNYRHRQSYERSNYHKIYPLKNHRNYSREIHHNRAVKPQQDRNRLVNKPEPSKGINSQISRDNKPDIRRHPSMGFEQNQREPNRLNHRQKREADSDFQRRTNPAAERPKTDSRPHFSPNDSGNSHRERRGPSWRKDQ
jgi:hypothetical protein